MSPANVRLDAPGAWRGDRFNDFYFQPGAGLEESRHVFLDGNDLSSRFRNADRFTVGETGFGSGLNVLACWDLWRRIAPSAACLHVVSVEKYPLRMQNAQRVLQSFPELSALREELLGGWPSLYEGFHRIALDGGRVHLTLGIGDACEMLRGMRATVDAWFLDGFAPAANPEMWTTDLFREISRLSAPGATIATFTVASEVRERLADAGFQTEKRPGFGRKRNMLTGRRVDVSGAAQMKPTMQQRQVIVIGAGLAGAAAARALADRGYDVKVFDRRDAASAASGSPVAIVQPLLARQPTPDLELHLAATAMVWREIMRLSESHNISHGRTGVFRPAQDDDQAEWFREIQHRLPLPDDLLRSVDAKVARELTGIELARSGVHLPAGGWVSPRALCLARLAHPAIELMPDTGVLALKPIGSDDQPRWALLRKDNSQIIEAPVVVLANGMHVAQIAQANWLPVSPVSGQISFVLPDEASRRLRCIISGRGWLTPAIDSAHAVGATFHRDDPRHESTELDDLTNLSNAASMAPALEAALKRSRVRSRWAGVRCTTIDRLPIVGLLVDRDRLGGEIAERHRARQRYSPAPEVFHQGLYVTAGHGSRGVATSALGAELIASQIDGNPLPMPDHLCAAVAPERFILRAHRGFS